MQNILTVLGGSDDRFYLDFARGDAVWSRVSLANDNFSLNALPCGRISPLGCNAIPAPVDSAITSLSYAEIVIRNNFSGAVSR